MPAKATYITLRVRPELKASLKALAGADGRTLTNYIEQMLEDRVKRKRKPTGK